MYLHRLIIEDKEAQIKRAKAAYEIKTNDSELQRRANEFLGAYKADSDFIWSKLKDSFYFQASDLARTHMRAAVFRDAIQSEDDLQNLYFDKFFPYLKDAGFPRYESKEWFDATQNKIRDWFLIKDNASN